MIVFLYFAIGCELVLVFFLISFFIEKTKKEDMKLLAIYCVIMLLFWPVILVKIIIDIIKNKIVNKKIKNKQ